jgi:hypothetical protein
MFVHAEGRVILDDEVNVWEIQTARGDVRADEDARGLAGGKGVEGGRSDGLSEGAMEPVKSDWIA